MIKLIRKILGLSVKTQKPRTPKKSTPKAPKRAAVKRDYVGEAVKETANAEIAERAAAKIRYKNLNANLRGTIVNDAIENARHEARKNARQAATLAVKQGKGRIYIIRVGKESALQTYRTAIDRAIKAYICDFKARQIEVQRLSQIGSHHEAKREAQRKASYPRAGRDIEQDVSISLREAYQGVRRPITIDFRDINFDIPRGAATGTLVQVRGAGNPGMNGGPRGNLLVTVHVAADDDFARVEDDLIFKRTIEPNHGDIVEVPTLFGPIRVKMPAWAQSGQTLCIAGRGMPKLGDDGSFGDLYIKVIIEYDPERNYMSIEGHEAMHKELEQLEIRLGELSRSTGATQPRESKVKKNTEFHDLQNQQAWVIMRMRAIQEMLHNAIVLEYDGSDDVVIVGSTVTLREVGANEDEEYMLVGATEANPRERRISTKSPVGRAVLGKPKGSKVKVKSPDGVIEFKIVEIE